MLSRRDTWIRIATFVGVTYVWSFFFMGMAISAGEITLVSALGGMWSPFVGIFVTRLIFPDGGRRGSLKGLGWGWGKTRWQVTSWFLPALYVGLAHGAVWAFGFAGFTEAGPGTIALFVLKRMAMGLTVGAVLAFGEEVGWQGFLVPRLYKLAGFTRAALGRGIVWSIWHFPLIIGGVYGTTATPLCYRLVCFTTQDPVRKLVDGRVAARGTQHLLPVHLSGRHRGGRPHDVARRRVRRVLGGCRGHRGGGLLDEAAGAAGSGRRLRRSASRSAGTPCVIRFSSCSQSVRSETRRFRRVSLSSARSPM